MSIMLKVVITFNSIIWQQCSSCSRMFYKALKSEIYCFFSIIFLIILGFFFQLDFKISFGLSIFNFIGSSHYFAYNFLEHNIIIELWTYQNRVLFIDWVNNLGFGIYHDVQSFASHSVVANEVSLTWFEVAIG
jgi:hypothetical protein